VRAALSASFTYGRKDATDRENPVVLPRNRQHAARAALRNVGGTVDRRNAKQYCAAVLPRDGRVVARGGIEPPTRGFSGDAGDDPVERIDSE
jgi:hypothetical protein